MHIDRYTKLLLTIIAASLVWISIHRAQAEFFNAVDDAGTAIQVGGERAILPTL